MTIEPLLLSVKDAAEALGVGIDTLRSLIEDGKLPICRFSDGPRAKMWIDRRDFDRLIKAHKARM